LPSPMGQRSRMAQRLISSGKFKTAEPATGTQDIASATLVELYSAHRKNSPSIPPNRGLKPRSKLPSPPHSAAAIMKVPGRRLIPRHPLSVTRSTCVSPLFHHKVHLEFMPTAALLA